MLRNFKIAFDRGESGEHKPLRLWFMPYSETATCSAPVTGVSTLQRVVGAVAASTLLLGLIGAMPSAASAVDVDVPAQEQPELGLSDDNQESTDVSVDSNDSQHPNDLEGEEAAHVSSSNLQDPASTPLGEGDVTLFGDSQEVNGGYPVPRVTCTVEESRASQKYWYFGDKAGIDFGVSGNTATAILSPHTTMEGSTVVTDGKGNLQFWTNGQQVFNRNQQVMENGSGLLGSPSATQTTASFPLIGEPGKYVVVNTRAIEDPPFNLSYSIVDMNLEGGLGAVTSVKNVQLGSTNTSSEAVAAAPSADGLGYWVLTYTMDSPNLLAYKFGPNGLEDPNPVVSVMPTSFLGPGYGSIAFNSDLTSMVVASTVHSGGGSRTGRVETLFFDADTGRAYEQFSWDVAPTGDGNGKSLYNAEFSPSGDFIYVTRIFGETSGGKAELWRYNVAGKSTSAEVATSKQGIGVSATGNGGQIRRAPDGRMYWADRTNGALHVVTNPDAPQGTNVGFQTNGFPLASGSSSQFGLPQMVTGCPPAVEIVKASSVNNADVEAGDTITYTVTATNHGAADFTQARPFKFSDDLSGVLDDGALVGDGPGASVGDIFTIDRTGDLNYTDPRVSWSGALETGQSVKLTYKVQVQEKRGGDSKVGNVAFYGNPDLKTPDCEVGVTTGTVSCTESDIVKPKLTVTKTADKTENVVVGDVVTYSVTAKNVGSGAFTAANPAVVTDDLSDVLDDGELVVTSITPATGTSFDATTKLLTWEGALAKGATVTITYEVTMDARAGANGTARNIAFVGDGDTPKECELDSDTCAEVEFPVIQPGLKWQKVSAAPQSEPLGGSEWSLVPLDENGDEDTANAIAVVDCVADNAAECDAAGGDIDPEKGKILVKPLMTGDYKLHETKAPAGYKLLDDPIDVAIVKDVLDNDANFDLGDIVNEQQDVPAIPLTGGLGTLSFILGAGGIAVAAAALILIRARRQKLTATQEGFELV